MAQQEPGSSNTYMSILDETQILTFPRNWRAIGSPLINQAVGARKAMAIRIRSSSTYMPYRGHDTYGGESE